jgi:hypothetical protein
MFLTRSIATCVAAATMFALGGCATIVGDKNQLMPIVSTPEGASILIRDELGHEVFQGTTPTNVTLAKADGSYFGKKSYTVAITKPGFQTQTVQITASANGWYIGGNFIFGGLIGWLIVDPLTGAMYTLAPTAVNGEPIAKPHASHGKKGEKAEKVDGIKVVMLADVPAAAQGLMQRID